MYDSSNFTSTADRHCFVYVPRLCTECGTALGYFYNEDTHVLSCKCINKDCTNYGVDIPYKTCNVTDTETDTEEEGD